MIENEVEYDREKDGVTREAKLQKCKILTPNIDSTNNSIHNNCCTSVRVSRNNNNDKNNNNDNNNGEEIVINIQTNTVTTINGRNGEASEEKVNSENLNSSNGRSTTCSNSKSSYVKAKILKRPVENDNKMIVNNVGYDGKNPNEKREP